MIFVKSKSKHSATEIAEISEEILPANKIGITNTKSK